MFDTTNQIIYRNKLIVWVGSWLVDYELFLSRECIFSSPSDAKRIKARPYCRVLAVKGRFGVDEYCPRMPTLRNTNPRFHWDVPCFFQCISMDPVVIWKVVVVDASCIPILWISYENPTDPNISVASLTLHFFSDDEFTHHVLRLQWVQWVQSPWEISCLTQMRRGSPQCARHSLVMIAVIEKEMPWVNFIWKTDAHIICR